MIVLQPVHGIKLFFNRIKCDNCEYKRLRDYHYEVKADRPFSMHIPLFKLPISLDEMSYNADLGRMIPPAYLEHTLNETLIRIYSKGNENTKI